MGSIAHQMIRDLNRLLDREPANALHTFHATHNNGIWQIDIRFGLRRIKDATCQNVLTIHNITLAKPLRGYGFLTECLDMITEDRRILEKQVDWLYFEQCQYRLANHLVDRHGFVAERGLVTDAWRTLSEQMALAI